MEEGELGAIFIACMYIPKAKTIGRLVPWRREMVVSDFGGWIQG
jgi:hypothetical protein